MALLKFCSNQICNQFVLLRKWLGLYCVMFMKRIREQKVSANLLFLSFKLLLGLEFGLGLELELWLGSGIVISYSTLVR